MKREGPKPQDLDRPDKSGPGGCDDESRRWFLKTAGFSFLGAVVLGCSSAGEEKAAPLPEAESGLIPGRTETYATSCLGCSAGCGMLAKVRDGRPIKLEGNPQHPVSRGGLCAVGQASLLGLYDRERLAGPRKGGQPVGWAVVDRDMEGQLAELARRGGRVRYLSGPILSPTKRAVIEQFLAQFAQGRLVVYDPLQGSAILDAHQERFGVRGAPRLRFDRADLIVGVDADFLGTWISPVEFTRDVASRRDSSAPETFSRHVQFESRMSVTGTKADQRYRIAPHERWDVLVGLASAVARRAGVDFESAPAGSVVSGEVIDALARDLWAQRGHCLIVSGCEDMATQELCVFLNHILGNYGKTLELDRPSYQLQGDDKALHDFLKELQAGSIDGLFIDGVNPAFDLPEGELVAKAIAAVPVSVAFSARMDETAEVVDFVCPDHHFLESWFDTEPVHGVIGFGQPTVNPIGNTRSVVGSLSAWRKVEGFDRDLLRQRWGSGRAWDQRVHDGFAVESKAPLAVGSWRARRFVAPPRPILPAGTLSLVLYPKVGLRAGETSYNPWLQELPDPISKAVWDNYACLSPETARRLGASGGDLVALRTPFGHAIELPTLIQPGQHDGVVAVALGYGSELSRRFAGIGPRWIERKPSVGADGLVGVNAAPLLRGDSPGRHFAGNAVEVRRTGGRRPLALAQEYQSIEVPPRLAPAGERRRPNVQESTVAAVAAGSHVGGSHHSAHADLWPDDHPYTGHHWGMVIDLTKCTGCSSCVVACQAENNIPVVGRDEVRRNREMHWMRIDRYYAGDGDEVDVSHQPMMCQHCDNAPCETVCPVLATVHSEEGLNQQVYNRCVGTRYCMNNCPYKARRFNWFEYAREDAHANLALNPDVTIRSRGVMEKCSMCAQRIQEAKIEAKRTGRKLADGNIQTACQQSCPASAIVFGDMNDPASLVSQAIAGKRHYRVLDELNAKPSVGYLELVRNRDGQDGATHHG